MRLCFGSRQERCSRGQLRIIIRPRQSSSFLRHNQCIDDSSKSRNPVEILARVTFISWPFAVIHFDSFFVFICVLLALAKGPFLYQGLAKPEGLGNGCNIVGFLQGSSMLLWLGHSEVLSS